MIRTPYSHSAHFFSENKFYPGYRNPPVVPSESSLEDLIGTLESKADGEPTPPTSTASRMTTSEAKDRKKLLSDLLKIGTTTERLATTKSAFPGATGLDEGNLNTWLGEQLAAVQALLSDASGAATVVTAAGARVMPDMTGDFVYYTVPMGVTTVKCPKGYVAVVVGLVGSGTMAMVDSNSRTKVFVNAVIHEGPFPPGWVVKAVKVDSVDPAACKVRNDIMSSNEAFAGIMVPSQAFLHIHINKRQNVHRRFTVYTHGEPVTSTTMFRARKAIMEGIACPELSVSVGAAKLERLSIIEFVESEDYKMRIQRDGKWQLDGESLMHSAVPMVEAVLKTVLDLDDALIVIASLADPVFIDRLKLTQMAESARQAERYNAAIARLDAAAAMGPR